MTASGESRRRQIGNGCGSLGAMRFGGGDCSWLLSSEF